MDGVWVRSQVTWYQVKPHLPPNTPRITTLKCFRPFRVSITFNQFCVHFRSKFGRLTQTKFYPIFSFSPCESCALSPFLVTHTALWSPMPCSVNMNQENCAGLSTYLTQVTSFKLIINQYPLELLSFTLQSD